MRAITTGVRHGRHGQGKDQQAWHGSEKKHGSKAKKDKAHGKHGN